MRLIGYHCVNVADSMNKVHLYLICRCNECNEPLVEPVSGEWFMCSRTIFLCECWLTMFQPLFFHYVIVLVLMFAF
jgi:hypothetical protein